MKRMRAKRQLDLQRDLNDRLGIVIKQLYILSNAMAEHHKENQEILKKMCALLEQNAINK